MKRKSTNNYQKKLAEKSEAQQIISDLLGLAIKNINIRYINEQLIKCWETKNCQREECPSYKSDNLRCWQVAGTYCGGVVQGTFAQKYGDCKKCGVFKAACNNEIDSIGEQFNILLHLWQVEMNKVDSLNKELLIVESLVLKAVADPNVRYKNNRLIKCWEIKNCDKKSCQSYKNDDLRCWQIVGSYSEDHLGENFDQTNSACQYCEVFLAACKTEASAIGEQFNNMMHLIQYEKAKVDLLNKKLLQTLDSLDKKNKKILRLTITDNLTDLYNRRHLFDCLENELERARRYNRELSLMMIDIDGLKAYNDTFGHIAGDAVLKKIGEIIKCSARKNDIACRFGGDEFTLILPETDPRIALVVAERIRDEFKSCTFFPKLGKDKLLSVGKTTSIGIAAINGKADNLENLIDRADKAMYKAKSEGGNKTFLAPQHKHIN